jgi:hypothetical protein
MRRITIDDSTVSNGCRREQARPGHLFYGRSEAFAGLSAMSSYFLIILQKR